ncbi:hypothetical protein MAR_017915, partial [Mya arenaria]
MYWSAQTHMFCSAQTHVSWATKTHIFCSAQTRMSWSDKTSHVLGSQNAHALRPIDVLKIDIEGDEWYTIQQMVSSGALNDVKQISMETHYMPGGKGNHSLSAAEQLCQEKPELQLQVWCMPIIRENLTETSSDRFTCKVASGAVTTIVLYFAGQSAIDFFYTGTTRDVDGRIHRRQLTDDWYGVFFLRGWAFGFVYGHVPHPACASERAVRAGAEVVRAGGRGHLCRLPRIKKNSTTTETPATCADGSVRLEPARIRRRRQGTARPVASASDADRQADIGLAEGARPKDAGGAQRTTPEVGIDEKVTMAALVGCTTDSGFEAGSTLEFSLNETSGPNFKVIQAISCPEQEN